MKVGMEVRVLNFLPIQRLLMGVMSQEGEVVEEAFLQARDRLSLDSWVPGWVPMFVLLWVFALRRCSVF